MKYALSDYITKEDSTNIIGNGFSILCIEETGRRYFESYEKIYRPAKVLSFWPTIKISGWMSFPDIKLTKQNTNIKNEQKIINAKECDPEDIHKYRYFKALQKGHIISSLPVADFVNDPSNRIYPSLPDKNEYIIIYDHYVEKGRTLNHCIEDLLKLGYTLETILFLENPHSLIMTKKIKNIEQTKNQNS